MATPNRPRAMVRLPLLASEPSHAAPMGILRHKAMGILRLTLAAPIRQCHTATVVTRRLLATVIHLHTGCTLASTVILRHCLSEAGAEAVLRGAAVAGAAETTTLPSTCAASS